MSDLRGATRVVFDVAEGITEIVEQMHGTIQSLPGPLGRSVRRRPRGLTGLVYRIVRGSIHLIGRGVDTGLVPLEAMAPEGESTPTIDALRSALNGVCGDYLLRTENSLAIDMSIHQHRFAGGLESQARASARVGTAASPGKLLVLVHGLCMNDRQWEREGHDHGAALADELGYTPLYLRYNSGLHVGSNGRALAELLETMVGTWSSPIEELAIIGYSLGGLVARSACRYGHEAGHQWMAHLRRLVFLGTPHHGTPLERGGRGLDFVLELSPYSAPFLRIGKSRSAGITDLRHGSIGAKSDDPVPLPAAVKCYAIAAVRARRPGSRSERFFGDGLVPLDSALGNHRDETRSLAIPESRKWIGYEMGHLELLSRPEVYAQLRRWLNESDKRSNRSGRTCVTS